MLSSLIASFVIIVVVLNAFKGLSSTPHSLRLVFLFPTLIHTKFENFKEKIMKVHRYT